MANEKGLRLFTKDMQGLWFWYLVASGIWQWWQKASGKQSR
jgi:hypothetical protein